MISNLQEGISSLRCLWGKQLAIQNCVIQILQITYMNVGDSWYVAPHIHSWYELHYVASGKTCTVLDNETLIISPHEYYIIPPGCSHEHKQSEVGCGHEGFALRWQILSRKEPQKNSLSGKGMPDYIYLPELERGYADKKVRDASTLEEGMLHLFEMAMNHKASTLVLGILFCGLLFELSKAGDAVSWNKITDVCSGLTHQAITFLEDNFSEKLNMSQVAQALGVSYPYLAKTFKKDMDKTLVEYLRDIRVREVKKFLGNTDMTLKEIARLTGFDNEFYLSNVFRRVVGVSPKEYRERFADV